MRSRLLSFSAVIAALAIAGCSREPARHAPTPRPVSGERLVVHRALVADSKVVGATVETRDQAEARARIGGTLVSLGVRAGDRVHKGQLVGRVADQRLAFVTNAADAQVASASAQAAQAEAELKRTAYLFDNGVYAKARLEQVEAQAKAAAGSLQAARAQRSASAELSGQGAILAPGDGQVLKAEVPAGSVVSQGQSVATITSGPPVLRVEIPEADAHALKLGGQVAIFPEDLPGATTGTISQVYPAVTAGRVVADVTVKGLRPELVGQRVRVRLDVGRRQALAIPSAYVSHRFGLDYVTVVDRSGSAAEVAVQLSPTGDAAVVEVLSGLADGDVIVKPRG